MKLNKIAKITLPLALVASIGLSSLAFAAPAKEVKGVSYFAVPAGQVNCNQHVTDVCVVNHSSQTVFFSVPTLEQSGQLNPPQWADAYSNIYYGSLQVNIDNATMQPIFNQPVPNHSIIKISNNASLLAGSKLKVSVTH